MRLLYFAPYSHGGLADYTHAQANALSEEGIKVTILCQPTFIDNRNGQYETLEILTESIVSPSAISRKCSYVSRILQEMGLLDHVIRKFDFHQVLLTYSEYLAPLWAWRFRKLSKEGVQFGAIVHDPVRDFKHGPNWWHRRSIKEAYSFFSHAFVHEQIKLETGIQNKRITTTVIPHGLYPFPPPQKSRQEMREILNIPEETTLLLSFGHIRDGKNLDLVIKSLKDLPDCYLLVAGKEQSSGQKTAAWYQELAIKEGVNDRCRWIVEHIPESRVGDIFEASDLLMLTYSSDFRSASGVLSAAANYRLPCVASSGRGPLKTAVEKYQLGNWTEPDCAISLKKNIQLAIQDPPTPLWELYKRDNSWQKNAEVVKACLFAADHQ